MVAAPNKSAGGSYGRLHEGRPPSEMESSKLLTQTAVILIFMVMVLLPFVLSRLFISHIIFLPTAEYTEVPSPPSTSANPPVNITAYASDEEKRGGEQPQIADGEERRQNQTRNEEDKEDAGDGGLHQTGEKISADESKEDAGNSSENQQQQEDGVDGDPIHLIDFSVGGCNIWKGNWIPNDSPPTYTNETCDFIQGHQNCLKNGRPDHQYMHWRWKPHDCDLPLFDAKEFLDLVRGKAWAFVGDSIARNHFQSFMCFLAQVEYPNNLYRDEKDLFVRWHFPSYNFTLAVFWSPFLVDWTEDDVEELPSGTEKLHLDVVDNNWVSTIQEYDYIVLSAGQWFLKPSIYFMKNNVIGCHYCPGTNITQLGFYYGYRIALRTMYNFLISSSYNGSVFFRTFTPDHFENGEWHNGGTCMRTIPTHNATLDGVTYYMHKIQLEEFGRALQKSNSSSIFNIVDTIHSSLVRADGHPGPYRSVGSSRNDLPQDCLHWCLPGAIDTWSAMILEILRHA